jgi:hypothetical protein
LPFAPPLCATLRDTIAKKGRHSATASSANNGELVITSTWLPWRAWNAASIAEKLKKIHIVSLLLIKMITNVFFFAKECISNFKQDNFQIIFN